MRQLARYTRYPHGRASERAVTCCTYMWRIFKMENGCLNLISPKYTRLAFFDSQFDMLLWTPCTCGAHGSFLHGYYPIPLLTTNGCMLAETCPFSHLSLSVCRNILVDKPNDQSSRWSSESNYPPQVTSAVPRPHRHLSHTQAYLSLTHLPCLVHYLSWDGALQ